MSKVRKDQGQSNASQRFVVDTYFIENRNRLLEVAAFLDRAARAKPASAALDPRLTAFRNSLQILSQEGPDYTKQIQMLLSDQDCTVREASDEQNACGIPPRRNT